MRCARRWLPAALALLTFSGCATQRVTTGQWVQGGSFVEGSLVLVLPVEDVVERGEGRVGGSGAAVASAIRDGLLAHGVRTQMGEGGSAQAALEDGSPAGYSYVLKATIIDWEDNATEWSSNPDRAALSLELYQVSTRQLVATASHRVVGRSLELVPKSPHRFIPELAEQTLARVFGWPARQLSDRD